MDKFTLLTTGAVALEADNIDTDQIMPKQFLRGIDKSGLDKGLFYNLKHKADGSLDPKCVLNSPAAAKAAVLLAGPNFGCGSSREHAVWGLLQGGFRVVVAPSFGEIFYSNCFNNGLLACKVSVDDLEKLLMSCARILKLFLLLISPHGRFVPATLLSALRLHRVTAACSSWALTWSIRRSPKSMRSSVFANSTNGSFRG